MRLVPALVAAAVGAAVVVRVARSKDRRFLHPDGRSFTGELEVWGAGEPVGTALIDRRASHPVTVRISKGVGTAPGRADLLGVAVRVHGPGPGVRHDLLFSTAGHGRLLRHVPVLRRTFDTSYGTILSCRTGSGRKTYLLARVDPAGTALGRTLESVVAVAGSDDARLLLSLTDGSAVRDFGRVRFGAALAATADRALAFDPIRNAPADLVPSGTIHGTRAFAYRLSQRWRRVRPASGS